MHEGRKSANIKDFLAVLEATTFVETLLVISACILKSGVSQDTTSLQQYYALFGNTRKFYLRSVVNVF